MSKYDVVIIGGGLGGLECGIILSKEGMKVCVLEQHHTPGGNLQSFTRNGCIFDTGMHFFGSMKEGQYLRKYFDYFGISEKLRLKQLDTDACEITSFNDGNEYTIPQGYKRFKAEMAKQFPAEGKSIEDYISGIISVTDHFPLYRPEGIDTFNIPLEILQKCATGFFITLTENDRLRNVLAGGITLYPGHAERTPLYIHACSRDAMINSCWRPVGGSQQIADAMVDEIRKHGGEVHISSKVVEIETDEGEAKAVVLENGERIAGNNFISNAHPVTTLKLIPENRVKKYYRKRIMNMENSDGAFVVYGVFKKNSFPYLNRNYFHYRNKGVLHPSGDEKDWPDSFYFYTPAHTDSDRFARSFIAVADMKYAEVSRWEGTKLNHRGDDYIELKAAREEQLLNAVEERFPGLRKNILKTYTSTPLTFKDYTGTHEGSAYGVMKDCNDPLRSIILPRTKIRKLFFTGQNLNLYGMMGVTAGAVITCSELLGLKYLTNKIANG